MLASLYLVECFWPGVTRAEVEAANTRARATARGRGGASLRFVGSPIVPGDEVAWFQFRAASRDAVVETSRDAKLPFDRVAGSLGALSGISRPSTRLAAVAAASGRSSSPSFLSSSLREPPGGGEKDRVDP